MHWSSHCLAGVLSALLIALLLRTKMVALFLDSPDQRKQHQNLVPRMGGFGIIAACLTVWLHQAPTLLELVFAASAAGLMLLGLLDDSSLPHYIGRLWHRATHTQGTVPKFDLRVRYKLLIEFGIAGGTVWFLDLPPPAVHFASFSIELGVWAFPAVVMWVIVAMNAFNLVDGIDGLAGSLGILSLATIAGMAALMGMPEITLIASTIACATAGFLIHNISPARVFLGDMGSLFIGYAAATLSLMLLQPPQGRVSLTILPLVIGLPLLDVGIAIFRRFTDVPAGAGLKPRLKRIVSADSNHLHHRLLYLGLSHMRATLVLCGLSALILLCAFGFVQLESRERWMLVAYTFIALSMIIYSIYYRDAWENMQRRFLRFLRHRGAKPFRLAVVSGSADTLEALLGSQEHPFELISISQEKLGQIYRTLDGVILEQEPEESPQAFASRVFSLGATFAPPIAAITTHPEVLAAHPLYSRWEDRLTLATLPLDVWPMLTRLLGQVVKQQNPSSRLISLKLIGL